MIWELPTGLEVNGKEVPIRSDFRDVLKVIMAFSDPDLTPGEKMYICLSIIYPDFEEMPDTDYEAAYKAAVEFIDNGSEKKKSGPRTMDWEQDAQLLFPAINTVAGQEVRTAEYIHWHTFLGYFLEINKSIYSTVLSLRQKKAKGKKLEKWEQEFWASNREVCVLKPKLTEEEKAEKERLKALLGG